MDSEGVFESKRIEGCKQRRKFVQRIHRSGDLSHRRIRDAETHLTQGNEIGMRITCEMCHTGALFMIFELRWE